MLIKSTLASLPLYKISLFRMLLAVSKRLEKVQRDFLLGVVPLAENHTWLGGIKFVWEKSGRLMVENSYSFEQNSPWKMDLEICFG